jgi:hypothetical protein
MRLSAMIEQSSEAVFALDAAAFPVNAMATSLIGAQRGTMNGPFAPLFPTALAMTSVAMLALQVKQRMRRAPALDLDDPSAWISAYLQSGAALLLGRLLARTGGAVDEFVHSEDSDGLPRALAGFLKMNAAGGALWYARRGADRLLWEAIQTTRGRDVRAAYARMATRDQG